MPGGISPFGPVETASNPRAAMARAVRALRRQPGSRRRRSTLRIGRTATPRSRGESVATGKSLGVPQVPVTAKPGLADDRDTIIGAVNARHDQRPGCMPGFERPAADIDHHHAPRLPLAQKRDEAFDIRHRQRAGQIIEDRHLRALADRHGHRGQPPLRSAEVGRHGPGVDHDRPQGKDFGGLGQSAQPAAGIPGQDDVLRCGQPGDRAPLAGVHCDPGDARGFGPMGTEGGAPDLDGPCVGLSDAIQRLQDGGLPPLPRGRAWLHRGEHPNPYLPSI